MSFQAIMFLANRPAHAQRAASCVWLLVLLLCPPAAAETAFFYSSQPGDFIGQGMTRTLSPADFRFTVDSSTSFSVDSIAGSERWDMSFAPISSGGSILGAHEHATRTPFRVVPDPGIDVTSTGRGCNISTGRFDILEDGTDGMGQRIFAVDFEQHCEGGLPGLYGSFRLNSSVPINPRPIREVIRLTNFNEPPLGAASYTPGPGAAELGFQTVSSSVPGQPSLVGVDTGGPGGGRGFVHRAVMATTTFDTVDLSLWRDVMVSVQMASGGGTTSSTNYESGDFLRIEATNGDQRVELFNHSAMDASFDGLEHHSGFGLLYYGARIPDNWASATLVITSATNEALERFDFDRVRFEGIAIPEPQSIVLAAISIAAVLLGRFVTKTKQSRSA